MIRYLFIIFIFFNTLDASVQVVRASEVIKYKAKINKTNVFLDNVSFDEIKRYCKPITKDIILNKKNYAKSYIKKGHIICVKDIYHIDNTKQQKLLFNFGSIQIETNGKIIKETNRYIKYRNSNNKIEKIYKDGRN